jgi:hypothetical protein
LKAVARGRQWSEDLLAGRAQSVTEIAEGKRVGSRYVRRLMRLAFLAPEIVEAIAAGVTPSILPTSLAETPHWTADWYHTHWQCAQIPRFSPELNEGSNSLPGSFLVGLNSDE